MTSSSFYESDDGEPPAKTPPIRPEYQIDEHEGMHEVDILDENEEDKDDWDATSDDDSHSLEMNQNAVEHPSEVHIEQNQQLNTEVSKFASLKKFLLIGFFNTYMRFDTYNSAKLPLG